MDESDKGAYGLFLEFLTNGVHRYKTMKVQIRTNELIYDTEYLGEDEESDCSIKFKWEYPDQSIHGQMVQAVFSHTGKPISIMGKASCCGTGEVSIRIEKIVLRIGDRGQTFIRGIDFF